MSERFGIAGEVRGLLSTLFKCNNDAGHASF